MRMFSFLVVVVPLCRPCCCCCCFMSRHMHGHCRSYRSQRRCALHICKVGQWRRVRISPPCLSLILLQQQHLLQLFCKFLNISCYSFLSFLDDFFLGGNKAKEGRKERRKERRSFQSRHLEQVTDTSVVFFIRSYTHQRQLKLWQQQNAKHKQGATNTLCGTSNRNRSEGKGKRELQKRFQIWITTHAVMLEQLLIFTRGGLLLWTCQELANSLKGSPVNALIRYNGSQSPPPPSLFLLFPIVFPASSSLISSSLSLSLVACQGMDVSGIRLRLHPRSLFETVMFWCHFYILVAISQYLGVGVEISCIRFLFLWFFPLGLKIQYMWVAEFIQGFFVHGSFRFQDEGFFLFCIIGFFGCS